MSKHKRNGRQRVCVYIFCLVSIQLLKGEKEDKHMHFRYAHRTKAQKKPRNHFLFLQPLFMFVHESWTQKVHTYKININKKHLRKFPIFFILYGSA